MTRHQQALAWLEKHEGEHEQPMGSNSGPFVQSCQASTWLTGTHWPWCVAAWVKAWTVAGYKLPYKGAGAYAMLDWYRQHQPGWVVAISVAKPGAAVIVNEGAGHCAMLARPYDGSGTVHTIDGNWGDKVTVTTHHASMVRGVVDPPEKSPAIVMVAKPPVFEVVTSASGHSKVVFVGGRSRALARVGPLLNRFGGVTIRRRKKKP